MNNIPQDNMPNDQRKLVINGRRYYTMTAMKCSACSDVHFMYVKQKHTGGCVTIECVNCDGYLTVREEMVNYNLNG